MKGKRGRPKKKPIESFEKHPRRHQEAVEETADDRDFSVEPEAVIEKKPEAKKHDVLCECGKVVQPKSHQCWDCSHRS